MKKFVDECSLVTSAKIGMEERYYEKNCLKFISYCINPSELGKEIKEDVSEIRQTLLFSKKHSKPHFCELALLKIGTGYIVTVSEYRTIKTKFGEKGIFDACFNDVYISDDIKYFFFDEDDIYLQYLMAGMKMSSPGVINTNFLNSDIKDMLLFNKTVANSLNTVYFPEHLIVREITNLLRSMEVNKCYLNWNKHFLNSHIKTESYFATKYILLTHDLTKDISDHIGGSINSHAGDGLIVCTLYRRSGADIFENTLAYGIIPKGQFLNEGTQIFIKNNDCSVSFCLESYDEKRLVEIETTFKITTSVKVIIYQSNVSESSYKKHFIEKEFSISLYQMFEIFKKALKENLKNGEFLIYYNWAD